MAGGGGGWPHAVKTDYDGKLWQAFRVACAVCQEKGPLASAFDAPTGQRRPPRIYLAILRIAACT